MNLDRVLYLCLTLDWFWSGILLASTFTSEITFTFLEMQKMYAEVSAHNRSSRILVKLSTDSDARPANHNAHTKIVHILLRWTCVRVCVTGPLV